MALASTHDEFKNDEGSKTLTLLRRSLVQHTQLIDQA